MIRVTVIVFCLFAITACDRTPVANERPNFLIIFTDDMGFTDLGAFGGGDIATPNLDRLAENGIRFGNFHGSASCAPSRAMLMTGTGNHEAGFGTQSDYEEFRGQVNHERYLTDRVVTVAEVLQRGGYRTYMAGKWHMAGDPGVDPVDRGFDKAFSLRRGGDGHYDAKVLPLAFSLNGELLEEKTDNSFSTSLYLNHLLNFFAEDRASDKPFFAWFAPTAPHWPLHFPPEMESTYDGAYDEGYEALKTRRMRGASEAGVLPPGVNVSAFPARAPAWNALSDDEKALQRKVMEIYAAMIDHLDQEVGRLLTFLEETGELDNTLILFINDNGAQGGPNFGSPRSFPSLDNYDNSIENLGAPDSWVNMGQGWAEATTAPYRDGKGSPYEGGVRVAAFASGAQVLNPGSVSFAYLNNMDVLPTLLEFAGLEHPAPEFEGREVLPPRGRSFAGLLRGDASEVHAGDEAIVLSAAGRHYMTRGDWKLLKDGGSDWELYNIASDPFERNELAATETEVFDSMRADFEHQAEVSNILDRNSSANPDVL